MSSNEGDSSVERDVSNEGYASREPEHEQEDVVMISEQLREAGFSAVNEASIKEWLIIDSNEPGHTDLQRRRSERQ